MELYLPSKLVLYQKMTSGRLSREEALLAGLAEELGVPVVTASEKMMERARVALDVDCMVAGSVPFILHALRRLGAAVPAHTPYPDVLKPWLHRQVQRRTHLRDVLDDLNKGGRRVFVKPADGWKRFTGFVAESSDLFYFNGASKNTAVWVSDPIEIVSEWRAYVAHGEVLDIRFADHGGDRSVVPDGGVIHAAVAQLVAAGVAPAGFVIDFGVLKSGQTALIEMNDGFSFGAYGGVSARTYWAVAGARWRELMSPK